MADDEGAAAPMQLGFGCVGLGTVSGGRRWDEDVRLITEAIDRGVRVLDTADVYANGASERIVGMAIGGRRDDVVLATKGGYLFRERSALERALRRGVKAVLDRLPSEGASDGRGLSAVSAPYLLQDVSPEYLRRALDASLSRLGTDHVDVYHVHGPPGVVPGLVDELSDLRTVGKVRRFGVGAESVHTAAEWIDEGTIDVVELPVGILDPDGVEVVRAATAKGIEVWARGVFAGGVLTIAERRPEALRADPKWPLIKGLQELADRAGTDVFALAIGFIRSLPGVSTVLLGMSARHHLDRNLGLMAALPLDVAVLDAIRALHEEYRGAAAMP